MLTVGKAETATKNNLKVGKLTIYTFMKKISILIASVSLISCQNNVPKCDDADVLKTIYAIINENKDKIENSYGQHPLDLYPEEKINEVFKDIDIKDILGNNDKVKKPLIENIEGRTYEILSNSVEVSGYRGRRKTIILLYLIDRTLYYQMKEKYNQEKHTIAFIQIDNYQDVMQSTSENNRS